MQWQNIYEPSNAGRIKPAFFYLIVVMMFKFFFLTCCFFLFTAIATNAQDGVKDESLRALLKSREDNNRFGADSLHPLGDHSEAHFKKNFEDAVRFKKQLDAIDTTGFDFSDQVTIELLQFTTQNSIDEYALQGYLNPILADGGFHMNLPFRIPQTIRNQRAAQQYLNLLRDIPHYVDQHITLMRKGLSLGISQPEVVVRSFANSYNQHIVNNADSSAYYAPFAKRPAGMDEKQWTALQMEASKVIDDIVIPVYKRIKAFFENEYIPKTRKTLGATHFPNGKAYYQQKVNYFTTTTLPYDEIYAIGLKEVERIEKEMLLVIAEVKFKGSLQDFIAMLRTDPRFYPKSGDELLKEASFIAKRIDGKLPLFFGKLPRLTYTVAPVPSDLAPNYTAGRYSPGRGTRAGEYWVNLYDLPSRPLYNLEALSLHEAVPGHHLQMALSLELENKPAFRKNLYLSAFGEGWALYCEYLGTEMGFFTDPYSRFGKLTYEMWRACRLVVDVGLHAKDWTRQQAVDYLASHTALSLHEVNTEVDRYIAWPGQALSYKMGELKIRELRNRTEKALGQAFDIRSFHDMLLSQGTVTLSIMEKMVDRFIAEELQRRRDESGKTQAAR